MKQTTPWRRPVLVAGTLLGLLAPLGLAAPATAAIGTASGPSIQHHDDDDHHDGGRGRGDDDDAELRLTQRDEDEIRVRGTDYDEDGRIRVWLVQFDDDDDDDAEVVDRRRVRANDDGNFRFTVDDLDCGDKYQAFSWSRDDGWVKSNKIELDCDD